MKTALLSILALSQMPCVAQDLPTDSLTGKITYSAVVKVDSATANELYDRALGWFGKEFKASGKAIGFSDREAGIIKSSPDVNFEVGWVKKNGSRAHYGSVSFSMTIECKPGRFRYTMTDLVHGGDAYCKIGPLETTSTACLYKGPYEVLRADVHERAIALIDGLKAAMSTGGSDW